MRGINLDYHQLFSRLNEKLSEENLQLHLHCVGGFVLEYYGMKATEDIDAFYESTEKVEKIIQEIGEEFHVGTSNEPWLSQAVGEVMSHSKTDETIIFVESHLTVGLSSLESILIDKIQAGRTKDVPDIAKIMKKLKIESPDPLLERFKHTDGSADPAVILEAFSLAYGEEALKNYLRKNPKILRLLQ
ncbi:MAG: DUF6036 family nucleotidyltransferase [Lactococcus lactis]|uniref:DUF6036 family nucleotidyltransferase n=2 Tax=Lactococcus lactis TaxID=1358 RepID=A0AAP5UA40_9LACT|nr:DUF6036 family nucleotidyltransferase [Lactococcus lactis]BAL50227.1 unknown protein [Lactococcus lactis subsp. lactis IO-1]MCH5429195.1 DUF6036 family nucleotidyltransferase [Lactococcus lactis]MCO0816064.1 DUF6036 family nucleotidyltransferase [Lactococcus lactis]MDH8062952.1 DUF6036 family nucleotidyltransferase [Lactococcus lactis subsp. lactis]MDM7499045.1 DUF6036 family nucleotidyltransferase [Lactococcus lactis]